VVVCLTMRTLRRNWKNCSFLRKWQQWPHESCQGHCSRQAMAIVDCDFNLHCKLESGSYVQTAVAQITEQETTAEDMDNRYGPCSDRYHLRARRRSTYGHMHHMSHQKMYYFNNKWILPNQTHAFYSKSG